MLRYAMYYHLTTFKAETKLAITVSWIIPHD
jgi:hypothetical protein